MSYPKSWAISQKEFAGFGTYKYACIDDSPLSKYIISPALDKVVRFIPKTMAPNTLTLLGFCFSIMQVVLLSVYDPNFEGSKSGAIPSWVWFVCAFGQFMAHSLDGVDGKQARRLKKGSALGELFDHGVDAWTCSLIAMCVFSAIGVESNSKVQLSPMDMWLTLWILQLSFFGGHLEKFTTGVLYLPWAYDFSMVGLAIFYVVNGAIGTSYLHKENVILGIRILVFLAAPGLMIPMMFKIYKAKNPSEGEPSKRSWNEILLAALPLVSALATSGAWMAIMCYPQRGFGETNALRFVCFMNGALFANITCRLIILQMSSQKPTTSHYFNSLVVLFVFGFVVDFFMKLYLVGGKGDAATDAAKDKQYNDLSKYPLFITGGLIGAVHLFYCCDVIKNLSSHLNIYAFSVADKPVQDRRDQAGLKETV